MIEPIVKHAHVQINNCFVHLTQYGNNDSILRSPSNDLSLDTSRALSSTSASSSFDRTASADQSSNSYYVKRLNPKNIVVYIPGNPSVLGVSHDFLTYLYRVLSNSFRGDSLDEAAILAIAHNGFDHPDDFPFRSEQRICIENSELSPVEKALVKNFYDEPNHMEMQVLNKLIILKRVLKYRVEDCRFIFVGHSIGCYVILRMLQDSFIANSHIGSILVHPAIENIALTDRGRVYNALFSNHFDLVLRAAAFVLDKLLPESAKLFLAKALCPKEFVQNASKEAVISTVTIVKQTTLDALISMVKSEFKQVKDINPDTMIGPHVSKLKLIYAIGDHWVNTRHRDILRDSFPELHIEEQPVIHAFVMSPRASMDYAVKIGKMVQSYIDEHGH